MAQEQYNQRRRRMMPSSLMPLLLARNNDNKLQKILITMTTMMMMTTMMISCLTTFVVVVESSSSFGGGHAAAAATATTPAAFIVSTTRRRKDHHHHHHHRKELQSSSDNVRMMVALQTTTKKEENVVAFTTAVPSTNTNNNRTRTITTKNIGRHRRPHRRSHHSRSSNQHYQSADIRNNNNTRKIDDDIFYDKMYNRTMLVLNTTTSNNSNNNKITSVLTDRTTRQNVLRLIYQYSSTTTKQKKIKNNPSRALKLLELVLNDEKKQMQKANGGNNNKKQQKTILNQNKIFNVLKACQQPKSLDDLSDLIRLERILEMLQQKEEESHHQKKLWDIKKMISFALVALSRNKQPERAEALFNRSMILLLDDATATSSSNDNDDDDGRSSSSNSAAIEETETEETILQLNVILEGYAKLGRVYKAEQLLERMTNDLHMPDPNTSSCTWMIYAYTRKSGFHNTYPDQELPQKALNLLHEMEKEEEEEEEEESYNNDNDNKNNLRPNLYTYTNVLQCLANYGMVKEVQELYKRMEYLYETGFLEQKPDDVAKKCISNAIANQNKQQQQQQQQNQNQLQKQLVLLEEQDANHILSKYIDDKNNKNKNNKKKTPTSDLLDETSIQSIKDAIWFYINNNPSNNKKKRMNAEKALILLTRLLEEQKKIIIIEQQRQANNDNNNILVVSKGMVINVLRACQQNFGFASTLLNKLEYAFNLLEQQQQYLWDSKILREILLAMVKCTASASSWGSRFSSSNDNNNNNMTPSITNSNNNKSQTNNNNNNNKRHFNNNANAGGPERAEALLFRAIKGATIEINNYHFCVVLNGYAKIGNARKAERLLKRMNELYESNKSSVTEGPNTIAYNCVLDALVRASSSTTTSSSSEANTNNVDRAEALFNEMNNKNKNKNNDNNVQPDMYTYNSLLQLYCNNALGDKADELFQNIIQLYTSNNKSGGTTTLIKDDGGPTSYTYRIVIDALGKSGQTKRAEEILDQMMMRRQQQQQQQQQQPQERSRSISSNERHDIIVRPNKFHYNGVLAGYAREGDAVEAERFLQRMHDDFKDEEEEQQGEGSSAITVVAYNCVLNAWAQSGEFDSSFRIRALMDRMVEAGITPDLISYNCLLCACGNRGMANEAEQILKMVHALYEAGEIDSPPNTISYNYALEALAKSGNLVWSVLRAESLVNKLKEMHYSLGLANTKPTMSTYRNLLKCYCNWNLCKDAEVLLQKMHDLHKDGELDYAPDRASYQMIIDALNKSGGDDTDAPRRASALKKQMEEIYGKKEGGRQNQWEQETVIEIDQVSALLDYMQQ